MTFGRSINCKSIASRVSSQYSCVVDGWRCRAAISTLTDYIGWDALHSLSFIGTYHFIMRQTIFAEFWAGSKVTFTFDLRWKLWFSKSLFYTVVRFAYVRCGGYAIYCLIRRNARINNFKIEHLVADKLHIVWWGTLFWTTLNISVTHTRLGHASSSKFKVTYNLGAQSKQAKLYQATPRWRRYRAIHCGVELTL